MWRKFWGKAVLAVLAGGMMVPHTVYGAEITRITSVNLTIHSEIEPGGPVGEETIEVVTENNHCTVSSYEVINTQMYWEEASVPEVKIDLYAADNYKFSYIGAKNLKVNGKKADFISSKRDEKDTLISIVVRLNPLYKDVDRKEVEGVELSSDAIASWKQLESAEKYEIRLYRNEKAVGEPVAAYGIMYDFSQDMKEAGDYYFKIRPISKYDGKTKGLQAISNNITVKEDSGTAAREEISMEGKWIQDQTGWRYENPGSVNPFFQWQFIDGSWYYFDPDGYLVTGWVEWNQKSYYCQEDGRMMMNQTAPDGSVLGADGGKLD